MAGDRVDFRSSEASATSYTRTALRTGSSRPSAREHAMSRMGEDLKFLETLATPSPGARVFGSVVHWDRNPATGETRDNGPVSYVVLTLRGPDRSFEARTDEAGRYQLAGLPPGRYELTALPPPLFRPVTSSPSMLRKRATRASCRPPRSIPGRSIERKRRHSMLEPASAFGSTP